MPYARCQRHDVYILLMLPSAARQRERRYAIIAGRRLSRQYHAVTCRRATPFADAIKTSRYATLRLLLYCVRHATCHACCYAAATPRV